MAVVLQRAECHAHTLLSISPITATVAEADAALPSTGHHSGGGLRHKAWNRQLTLL